MEMPEQDLPVVFSQMLQMFPNVPQEIIWLYVQRYSSNIEKCAQMLNLQNGKYASMKPTLNDSRNLNECHTMLQAPHFMQHYGTVLANNNEDVPLSNQLPLLNIEEKDVIRGINHNEQTEEITNNSCGVYSSSQVPTNAMHENSPVDSSKNLGAAVNFNEPLILDIVPDDDGISHSWRPNVTDDILCSDLFAPSRMFGNFQLNSNQIPGSNFVCNNLEIRMDPEGTEQEPCGCSSSSMHRYYDRSLQVEQHCIKDISSYLHYQKAKMNVIWYELIKAKIEQGDLKECVEKLSFELKEKMQSKSVQDIEELNEEIVQLRLECQCLCTDVDHLLNDQGLLGEVDEKCYEKNITPLNSADTQSTTSHNCPNSRRENDAADVHDESNRWQCPKCTFANHSAINVCEMCNVPKPGTRMPPFAHAAPNSCYCHSEEKSLSVQS